MPIRAGPSSTEYDPAMGTIIRVFRGTAASGRVDDFRAFFVGEAVEIVRRFEGLLSVQVGLPSDLTPREFLMITEWRDLASLKAFAGENWQAAYIAPEEAPLLETAVVHHYERSDV